MKKKQMSLIFFLIIQLYIYVMLISFNNLINSKILSFLSILLCFIMGLFLFCKTKDYYIMILALFFTLIGEAFFIFFDKLDIIGLVFLNLAQLMYFLRIYIDTKYRKSNVTSRFIGGIIIIAIGYFLLQERMDTLVILWLMYIVNLFINILFTIKEIGINNFFPIGLLLMFISSICAMFIELPNYLISNNNFLDALIELPFNLKWVFYLPSQAVLTCSIFTVNRKVWSKFKDENRNSE